MPPLEPRDVATTKFLNAVNEFMDNPPRDLPEGTADTLKEITNSLKGYTESSMSPGEKEVAELTNTTDGTGTPYSKAAVKEDAPSPGQQEFERVIKEAKAAAQAMAAQNNQAAGN
jgi:hypothetical protein